MALADIALVGGILVTSQGKLKASIAIEEGKIVYIGSESSLPRADRVIRADDRLIMPGVVDTFVHLREPGFEHKEDFLSGTRAAAAGGVTLVVDDSMKRPPTKEPIQFKERLSIAEGKAIVDFSLAACLSPDNLSSLEELSRLGALCYELYLGGVPDDYIFKDLGLLREAFHALAPLDALVAAYPQLDDVLRLTMARLLSSGKTGLEAHSNSRPPIAEASAILLLSLMAREAGIRLHLRQLSCRESLEVIRMAKGIYNRISCDVSPHHLLLTKEEFEEKGSLLKVNPPLRSLEDREALWSGLRDGFIDLIASDHAPHLKEEKGMGDRGIWDASPGLPGLETTLRLMLTKAKEGRLSLEELVALLCERPAKFFGLYPKKGSIKLGSDADLVMLDIKAESEISSDGLYTKPKWTPWEGFKAVKGPILTMVRGEVVMENGEVIGRPGHGRFTPSIKGDRA